MSTPTLSSEPMTSPTQVPETVMPQALALDYPTQERPANQATIVFGDNNLSDDFPTQEPPSQALKAVQAAAWQNNKKVTGMWSNCADRNTYMHIDGVGWRKFIENSESAMIAFNLIAAHAKSTDKAITYYEDDNTKVTTVLVW